MLIYTENPVKEGEWKNLHSVLDLLLSWERNKVTGKFRETYLVNISELTQDQIQQHCVECARKLFAPNRSVSENYSPFASHVKERFSSLKTRSQSNYSRALLVIKQYSVRREKSTPKRRRGRPKFKSKDLRDEQRIVEKEAEPQDTSSPDSSKGRNSEVVKANAEEIEQRSNLSDAPPCIKNISQGIDCERTHEKIWMDQNVMTASLKMITTRRVLWK